MVGRHECSVRSRMSTSNTVVKIVQKMVPRTFGFLAIYIVQEPANGEDGPIRCLLRVAIAQVDEVGRSARPTDKI